MKNTNAQKIVKNYRIKCVLIAILYAVGVAICIAIIGKNTLLGIACTVVLAASINAPFDKLLEKDIESVTFVGLCTDICVVSNALILKANYPDTDIYVDSSCCAGVTPEKHQAALETMRSCQIIVRGE